MPVEELELLIRITLATNPNIQEDSSMPEHYQTAKKKRKVIRIKKYYFCIYNW